MAKRIHHTFLFPDPPGLLWEYLTKSELISQWLMENDFLPIIGHDFQFHTMPLPNLNFDGIVYCKVLEIILFKKLSYSWKPGPGNGEITVDSVVVWTLNAKDKLTQLSLDHSGFKETDDSTLYSLMNEGWLKNIKKIAYLINIIKHAPATT